MAHDPANSNAIRACRLRRGWSQIDLARRAGISRAAVSAIEVGRLVPSVAAAIGVAGAFGCAVESLFGAAAARPAPGWAWPGGPPWRDWHAEGRGRTGY